MSADLALRDVLVMRDNMRAENARVPAFRYVEGELARCDEIAAREAMGPHHTPIRCEMYQRAPEIQRPRASLAIIVPAPPATRAR